MTKFILKRFAYGFLVLVGVITVVFLLFNVLPGDPARMMLGQRADEASIKAINKDLGRDKSLPVQFLMYINDLSFLSIHETQNKEHHLFLDDEKYSHKLLFSVSSTKVLVLKYPYLRRSYQSKRLVSDIIYETMPETAVLAFASMLFATVVGVILGVFSAIKQNSLFDNSSLVFAVLGMAAPSFFMGLIIAWVFGHILSDYTGLNMVGSLYTMDDYGDGEFLEFKNLILPALTLGIRPLAIIIQLTRSSLLDVLTQDYIRTAKAKGLGYYTVIFKHALKNALNPVVTTVSGMFASLMAGAVFVEWVFGWKGIGSEVFSALDKYDFPVVMGTVLVIATFFVVINVIVDIVYGILDPRVRVK
ncbi:MAG: ABC transporter permease [Bacteroidetes bacterium]|nr:ABC transporter permease [Bacteroidota bacterium]HET6243672.1 ABC transporter permease [Bacteroidia bacterium]